jgi:hypothetical protein
MSSVIGLPVIEFGKEKAEAFRGAFVAIGVDEGCFADFERTVQPPRMKLHSRGAR